MSYLARRGICSLLALGLIGASQLAAQTAGGDLATLCRSLGQVKVGQWARYGIRGGQLDGFEMRIAAVGSEARGDTTLYWIEVRDSSSRSASGNWIAQVLVPSFVFEANGIHGLVFKSGSQPAARIPDELLPLVSQRLVQMSPAVEMGRRCASAQTVGWENVNVPAGSIRALHVRAPDGDAWLSQNVPFAAVKVTPAAGGETALLGSGFDAKSSITETPQLMLQLPGLGP
ncbi:MAG TPA: hypothetical protein VLT79_06220 [Gemmatimonadales bacterium]|nr:hypothetical protein [Gemmatimonadales bacterium]